MVQVGHYQTSNGKRRQEDCYASTAVLDYQMFAVFDGHGGAQSAQWCGRHLARFIERATYSDLQWPHECIEQAFRMANHEICMRDLSSGTTASVFLWNLDSSQYVLANVGDSTIVACENGRPVVLSQIHRASEPLEQQRILSMDGQVLWGRINGDLEVSRSLGDFTYKPFASYKPFVTCGGITEAIEYVIVASDGVWDVLTPEEAVKICAKLGEASDMAYDLVQRAIKKGSRDNITCGVVLFRESSRLDTPWV